MPNAAHNRSDSTCGGSGRSAYSRMERRSFSASIRGFPPDARGGGSVLVFAASAASPGVLAKIAAEARPAFTWRRVIMACTPLHSPQVRPLVRPLDVGDGGGVVQL